MTLPAWPSSLPPLVAMFDAGATDELYPEPQSTTFDDGPDRVRRRRYALSTPRTMSLRLTRAQFATFRAFVTDTLNTGALRFTGPVRSPAGTLATHTCRIAGKVAERDAGSTSIVSFVLRIYDW